MASSAKMGMGAAEMLGAGAGMEEEVAVTEEVGEVIYLPDSFPGKEKLKVGDSVSLVVSEIGEDGRIAVEAEQVEESFEDEARRTVSQTGY